MAEGGSPYQSDDSDELEENMGRGFFSELDYGNDQNNSGEMSILRRKPWEKIYFRTNGDDGQPSYHMCDSDDQWECMDEDFFIQLDSRNVQDEPELSMSTLSSGSTLLESLGATQYIQLLKRVYGENLVVGADNVERGQIRGRNGKIILAGSMTLFTCVSYLSMTRISHLVVRNANLAVTSHTKQYVTHGVNHVELADDVTYTPQQLTSLVHSVAQPTALDILTLHHSPISIDGAVSHTHKVKKMVIKWEFAVLISYITSLMHHLDVDKVEICDARIFVDGQVGQGVRRLDVERPLSLSLLTTLCNRVAPVRELHLEYDFVIAMTKNIEHSASPSNDTNPVGQCVETLYADCHLSLSSLTTLCSMLSHSLRLTSHFGLTDDTEHSNDVNQVCHLDQMIVNTKLSLVHLNHILRRIHIDNLWLGHSSFLYAFCNVMTRETNHFTSLPGVSTLGLYHVHGARALFGHIMAPDVRRVEVIEWRSDDQQHTVSHTALCHACPNAEVVYPDSDKDRGARRVNE